LAVKVVEVATPDPFVVTVSDTPPPEKVPLAPEPGAVKVTETPETGLLPASTTVAVRTEAKAVEIVALCPPPEGEVKAEGGPTVAPVSPDRPVSV
jgi:hypothetical protein